MKSEELSNYTHETVAISLHAGLQERQRQKKKKKNVEVFASPMLFPFTRKNKPQRVKNAI